MKLEISPLFRHAPGKVALSFSGGKDSLACLFLLRDHLKTIAVYHLDTGDTMPETRALVAEVKKMCPNFIHLQGDIRGWIEKYGLPTDLLPFSDHGIGVQIGERDQKLVTRYHCCYINLMFPLWERMKADGNTLIIRGTKRSDMPKLPVKTGDTEDGIEFWYPIEDWIDSEVHAYLVESEAPHSMLYPHFTSIPDCARCTAWWTGKRAVYLREHHPDLFADYARDMKIVAKAVAKPINALRRELAEITR
jgi:3'-phosphoadenosine 5'-phosphosulfate sulfotransferase (PAPS reductase)/FAD synthetase